MITVNYKEMAWKEGLTLGELRKAGAVRADVATVNGVLMKRPWDKQAVRDGDKVIMVKRGRLLEREDFEHITRTNIRPEVFGKINAAVVGIAGLGGLGSHVAGALARVWPGKMILADFDVVEPSNLNRQQYFMDQVGMLKVDATWENLNRVNPHLEIETHAVRLTAENIPEIFAEAGVVVECFDRADQKQMIAETVLMKMKSVIISGSGLAGYGRSNEIATRRLSQRHILVGDCVSASGGADGLMAPRVGVAAFHQANAVVEKILEIRD